MAKKDDAEALGTVLSEETLGYLEEVKKGKSRKFVLLCKGVSPVSLVLYKKGSVEKYRKEAKEVGKGQAYFGVVQGKGLEITFCLAIADGFTEAPVKNSVLKGFLDEGGFKCKPTVLIVEALPLALDDSDPLVQRYLAAKTTAEKAAVNLPEHAGPLKSLIAAVPPFLEADDADAAARGIDAIEAYVAKLSTSAAGAGTAGDPASANKANDEAKIKADPRYAKLAAALGKLKPLVMQLSAAQPQFKAELLGLLQQAALDLKQGLFDAAQAGFVQLAQRLKQLAPNQKLDNSESSKEPSAPAESAEPMPGEAALRIAYEKQLARLEPKWLLALEAPSEENSKLRVVMSFAQEQAESEAYEKAMAALTRLESMVDAILNSDQYRGGLSDEIASVLTLLESEEDLTPGVVEFRKLLLMWNAARDSVETQLNVLKGTVSQKYPERLEALEQLDSILQDFDEQLGDQLIDLINSPSIEDRAIHAATVGATVDEYLTNLRQHVLVAHADANPFTKVAVRNTLGTVLEQLRDQLVQLSKTNDA